MTMKQSLYDACRESLRERIRLVQNSIQDAQESANEETKSSAGDKYETGRAMAQLEIEKYLLQLTELRKQDQELSRISPSQKDERISPGSLVHTNHGIFFIAVNAGQIDFEGQKVFTISPQAPVSQKMFGLAPKDSFLLNGRAFTILSIE
jgi:transcription elongation GreA/GreB family factor